MLIPLRGNPEQEEGPHAMRRESRIKCKVMASIFNSPYSCKADIYICSYILQNGSVVNLGPNWTLDMHHDFLSAASSF
jgi:hypothetical protein